MSNINLNRSVLDTTFIVIKESASVGLDMTAPTVGFSLYGTPNVWYPSEWVPGVNTQLDPVSGLYYRSHRILIGPGAGAAVALTHGRWLIYRSLADNPETVVGVVAGTVTIS